MTDLAVDHLCSTDTDVELRERIANLEADIRSYRELAHAAIHALHELTINNSRLRASHHRLLDVHRARSVEAA